MEYHIPRRKNSTSWITWLSHGMVHALGVENKTFSLDQFPLTLWGNLPLLQTQYLQMAVFTFKQYLHMYSPFLPPKNSLQTYRYNT